MAPDTTVLFVLPQITYILNYFLSRNLLIARSRAYDITVRSRNKPDSFWSKGYVEEWQVPPRPVNSKGAYGKLGIEGQEQEKWLQWVLWWPSQMALRHCKSRLPSVISHEDQRSCPLAVLLIPLSPHLPIINVVFTSAMKALYTARTLHRPYFEVKQMSPQEVEIWLEERKWGYRGECFDAMVDHGADCRCLQALASRPPSSSLCQSLAWVSASRIESAPPCGPLIWRSASIDSLQAS